MKVILLQDVKSQGRRTRSSRFLTVTQETSCSQRNLLQKQHQMLSTAERLLTLLQREEQTLKRRQLLSSRHSLKI